MVEASWRVIQPIQENWNGRRFDFPNYEQGTWGPADSDAMIARQGRQWRNS
jgi:glucose-6-phosphate 1-dehydrogenase